MFGSVFDQDPVPEVPIEEQEGATRNAQEAVEVDLDQCRRLDEELGSLRLEYRERFRTLLGPGADAYVETRARIKEELDAVERSAEPTAAGERATDEARLAARDSSRAFLADIGFDRDAARALREEFHVRSARLRDELTEGVGSETFALREEEVPAEVHNPWAFFRPSFPGGISERYLGRTPGAQIYDHQSYYDRTTGTVGSLTRVKDFLASDYDYAYCMYKTGVRFWWKLPEDGRIELYMRLRAKNSTYWGDFRDEWGWSDAQCQQNSRGYMQVLWPHVGRVHYDTLLDYHRRGTDAHWVKRIQSAGGTRHPHIYSRDRYYAGKWALIEVGVIDYNFFVTNDVSVHSSMEMLWILDWAALKMRP